MARIHERMRVERAALRSVALVTLVLAASCGGGGGGGDPALPPAEVTGFAARPEDQAVLLSWEIGVSNLQYTLYFSSSPGVDLASDSSFDDVQSPFIHNGLPNGDAIYYVVVADDGGLASPPSVELSATPADLGDPLFKDQWTLENSGTNGATPGEDARLAPAWKMGYRGAGVLIAIVDDGLEIGHQDLVSSIAPGLSYNYLTGGTDPTGGDHGTSVGGIAGARGGNGVGLRGAAPRARLVGYNFLADPTLSNQIDAMVRGISIVDVSNNSWSSEDGTGDLAPSAVPWQQAVENGMANGRDGLGIVYVIAAGNGHRSGPQGSFGVADNSNYDGNANFHGLLTVGAVGSNGERALYSERGANLLVCGPSARDGGTPLPDSPKVRTVDRTGDLGFNKTGLAPEYGDLRYTRTFDGTSASTPLVAGVAALVIQANPELGRRDVREILALTARRNDPLHEDWAQSPAGHWVNHDYGFGVVDAGAAVTAAIDWTPVPPQRIHQSLRVEPNLPIPDMDPGGISVVINVSDSGITSIEHVEVIVRSDHTFTPDLEVVLVSPVAGPGGTFVSKLAEPHDTTQATPHPYQDWHFGSLRHMGQAADGAWRLIVIDHVAEDVGVLEAVQLVFRGR